MSGGALAADTSAPDFAHDVQPLFKKHCYECHGPDKQKNGFRLDRRSAAFSGIVRHNIIPGSSVSSRVYRRVVDSSAGPQMPLEDTLSDEEIETLRRWIDSGATWPDELANEVDLPPPDAEAVRLAALIRTSAVDAASRRQVMAAVRALPSIVNARGKGGTTPLMEAALYGDAKLLAAMLAAGGDPNLRNQRDASALLWAVDDLAKTRLLLDHGAKPNAASVFGQTPLTQAAAGVNSAAVVQLLLERGAEATQPALNAAARANPAALRLILARVPDKGDAAMAALRFGCAECLTILQPGAPKPMPRILTMLLPVGGPGDPDMLHAALELRRPDVNVTDPKGRTALMMAAISETVPPDFLRTIIARGAKVNALSPEGLNALDYARRLGRQSTIDVLTEAGLKPTREESPESLAFVPDNDARAAIARSVPLLQHSAVTFYEKGGCVSCHHNLLGVITTRTLQRQGLSYDTEIAAKELRVLVEDMDASRDLALQGVVVPGGATTTTGYILVTLAAADHPADAATDALVRLLRRAQWPDGRWLSPVRPPSEASVFTATSMSMRGIQLYGNARNPADSAALTRAAAWLRKAAPVSTEDRTFHLLGLTWARVPARERRAAMDALLAAQRADGGWAQLEYRASDAYATGQVLVALHEAGLSADAPAYQRGVRYLLDTQLTDGSWLVRTRSHFTQFYFDSGFPHGANQFISAGATNWATQALAWSVVPDRETGKAGLRSAAR
ncbi:MAG TPA: ankyrin repeat domain-containing protein [Steroidobacteraceae bacterium]|nr:ankyrin repeat domain-containing protein [Steroidobacteraceae bacterium]